MDKRTLVEAIPLLTPGALQELLKQVDQVCQQAQTLRTEIVHAMQRRRASDQSVAASRAPRPSRRRSPSRPR